MTFKIKIFKTGLRISVSNYKIQIVLCPNCNNNALLCLVFVNFEDTIPYCNRNPSIKNDGCVSYTSCPIDILCPKNLIHICIYLYYSLLVTLTIVNKLIYMNILTDVIFPFKRRTRIWKTRHILKIRLVERLVKHIFFPDSKLCLLLSLSN